MLSKSWGFNKALRCTEIIQGTSSDRGRGVIAALPLALLFLAYPLALIPAGFAALPYYFSLPVFFWLSLYAVGMLIPGPGARCRTATGRIDHLKAARWGLGTVFVLCLASALAGGDFHEIPLVTSLGMFAAPLCFAVNGGLFRRSIILPAVLGILWLLNAFLGVCQLQAGGQVAGLAGNRNWMAALVLALTPWAWECVRRCSRATILRLLSAVGIAFISLMLLYYCRSRAVWLALILYFPFLGFVLWRKNRKPLPAWFIAAAAVMALTAWLGRDAIERAAVDDIRLPLWRGTATLIADRAWLGTGPGRFTEVFPEYRLPAQMQRGVAAPVTEHPHNEVLNLAANLGIPLAVLWCLIPAVLFLKPRKSGGLWLPLHFSAFILVFHGMLDKSLAQAPNNMLALICLGLLWNQFSEAAHRENSQTGCEQSSYGRWICIGAIALLGSLALFYGHRHAVSRWHYRQGLLHESSGSYAEAYKAYLAAVQTDPGMLRARTAAGVIAARKLRQPEAALVHFAAAYRQNPNFGHINLDIARALGNLGRHGAAGRFFRRHLELFPLSTEAAEYRWRNQLITGDLKRIEQVRTRLAENRFRDLVRLLGTSRIQSLARNFYGNITGGSYSRAAAIAVQLAPRELYVHESEPRFGQYMVEKEAPPSCDPDLSDTDIAFWHDAREMSETVGDVKGRDIRSIVAAYRSSELAKRRTGEARQLLDICEILSLKGWLCNLIQAAGARSPSAVEAWDETGRPTVIFAHGQEWRIERLKPAWARRNRETAVGFASVGADAEIVRLIPIYPPQFCTRTQVLGEILLQSGQPDILNLSSSPMLHLRRIQNFTKTCDVPAAADVRFIPVR